MKFVLTVIGFQFIFLLSFSQQKQDTTKKAQPLRIEKSRSNISTKKISETKAPENKRVLATPINKMPKNSQNTNNNGLPENKRVTPLKNNRF